MDPNATVPQGENYTPVEPVQPEVQIPPPLEETPTVTAPPATPVQPVVEPTTPITPEPVTPPTITNPPVDQPPEPLVSQTPVEPPTKKNSPILMIAVILMLLAILVAGGYLLWTKFFNVESPTPEPTPVTEVIPTTTPNPTVNWEIYTNPTEKFSFKYPPTWTIDLTNENGDDRKENIQIKLNKDKANLSFYANMVGIGGLGKDYEGTEVTVDGYQLYKFKSEDPVTKMTIVGITNSLENSLGVFEVSGKTYSLTLSYPDSYDNQQVLQIETEFDQVLSTFKFPEATSTAIPKASPTSSPSATIKP